MNQSERTKDFDAVFADDQIRIDREQSDNDTKLLKEFEEKQQKKRMQRILEQNKTDTLAEKSV